MPAWYENESFWIDFYPCMFPPERLTTAEAEVDGILAMTTQSGGAVLDLCCGPGRHAIELARCGFQVTGVDRSAFLLDRAREWAQHNSVEVDWQQADMRTFVRPEGFDLIVNLFTAFGYFDRKEEDLEVLRNVHASLKPGGSFVLDVMGKERLARVFRDTTSERAEDGTLLVQRHEIFDDWTRLRSEWLLIKDEVCKTYRFHHTIYSGQELKDRLHRVGFGHVRLYGDFEGNEYGLDARRLIAVALKETG